MPMGAEEEGVDAEEEEVVAVALFELGADGPLMDKSSPQMVDEVPGVADLLPYPWAPPPPSPQVLLPPSQEVPRLRLPLSPCAQMPPLPQALGATITTTFAGAFIATVAIALHGCFRHCQCCRRYLLRHCICCR